MKVIHLMDYPPRGTACGLYYPSRLYERGFGTYDSKVVTCKKCLKYIKGKLTQQHDNGD